LNVSVKSGFVKSAFDMMYNPARHGIAANIVVAISASFFMI